MKKHLIMGGGNLGIDLKNEILRQSGDRRSVDFLTRVDGFDVRDLSAVRAAAKKEDYAVIWYCVGQGSVPQARDNPEEAKIIYGAAPKAILTSARPETKVVLFSTDYVADEEDPSNPHGICQSFQTEYASIRGQAERLFLGLNRPNTTVIRVGSLYGTHKPENTFPGRILGNFAKESDIRIRLPRNLVTPTPTLWLAAVLVEAYLAEANRLFNEQETTIHHCAPNGNVSVWDWGTFVLAGIRETSAFATDKFFDEERPKISALSSDFLPSNWHWNELWKTYFKPEWFMPTESKPGNERPSPESKRPSKTADKPA